jgi:hypothetical protein
MSSLFKQRPDLLTRAREIHEKQAEQRRVPRRVSISQKRNGAERLDQRGNRRMGGGRRLRRGPLEPKTEGRHLLG